MEPAVHRSVDSARSHPVDEARRCDYAIGSTPPTTARATSGQQLFDLLLQLGTDPYSETEGPDPLSSGCATTASRLRAGRQRRISAL